MGQPSSEDNLNGYMVKLVDVSTVLRYLHIAANLSTASSCQPLHDTLPPHSWDRRW